MTVGQALEDVDAATRAWFGVADELSGAIDRMLGEEDESPTGVSDLSEDEVANVRACQLALMMLHLAVLADIALVQRLETLNENVTLGDLLGWPSADPEQLEAAAFGHSFRGSQGFVPLLALGTDDGEEPTPTEPIDEPPPETDDEGGIAATRVDDDDEPPAPQVEVGA